MTSFNYNIEDIPRGPVTYPPGASFTRAAAAVQTPLKINQNIRSILKKTNENENNNVVITGRVKKDRKTVRWSDSHQARAVKNKQNIEKIVLENEIASFFKSTGVRRTDLPGKDDSPSTVVSKNPEDVKEIKRSIKYSITKMDNE